VTVASAASTGASRPVNVTVRSSTPSPTWKTTFGTIATDTVPAVAVSVIVISPVPRSTSETLIGFPVPTEKTSEVSSTIV
jgi:hypothetical protein